MSRFKGAEVVAAFGVMAVVVMVLVSPIWDILGVAPDGSRVRLTFGGPGLASGVSDADWNAALGYTPVIFYVEDSLTLNAVAISTTGATPLVEGFVVPRSLPHDYTVFVNDPSTTPFTLTLTAGQPAGPEVIDGLKGGYYVVVGGQDCQWQVSVQAGD